MKSIQVIKEFRQFAGSSSLMMEAVRTSETSVDNHFTRQYNPEDSSEHHTPSFLGTNILLRTSFTDTSKLRSSLVREEHLKTCSIIAACILHFGIVENRRNEYSSN
jgi:hypothetical protein